MDLLKFIVLPSLLLLLLLCGVLFFFQRSFIYFPQPAGNPTEAITITSAGVPVRVAVREVNGSKALLYFGGNAEDVSFTLPEFTREFPGRAIYMLHYRGYGGSAGTPSEQALFADALALFDQVHAQHPHVAVLGRSLGSGVAVYVASRRPVQRLVLVTPFDSLSDPAARQFPYLPVRWLLRDKFDSFRYAPDVTVQTLILAAEQDEIVPRESTLALQSRFRRQLVVFKTLPGTSHNTISNFPQYVTLIHDAIE